MSTNTQSSTTRTQNTTTQNTSSVRRFLAVATIALAGFGTACSSGGAETINPQAAEILADLIADEPAAAESVPTMANGEPYDEAYVMSLYAEMEAAATYQEYLAATSAFVTYMDSAPLEAGQSSSWTVDDGAVDALAAQYGVSEAEVQAAIDADPALTVMFSGAEQTADPVAEPVEDTDLFDDVAGQLEDDWTEDEWAIESAFLFPELADLVGPWGADGDHSCTTAVAHQESQGYAFGNGDDDAGTHAFVTGFFSTIDDATEVMGALDECEAWRQADQLAAAMGLPVLADDMMLITDEIGDGWALRVFQEFESFTTVVFIHEADQVQVYVAQGVDEYTAIDNAYMTLGY